jgi:hypothetical protein
MIKFVCLTFQHWKMGARCSSETSVNFQLITRRYIQDTERFIFIAVRDANPTRNKDTIKTKSEWRTRERNSLKTGASSYRLDRHRSSCILAARRWLTPPAWLCYVPHVTTGSTACGTSHEEPYTSKSLWNFTALRPVPWAQQCLQNCSEPLVLLNRNCDFIQFLLSGQGAEDERIRIAVESKRQICPCASLIKHYTVKTYGEVEI